ncbi:MAG TPA: zinc-dependent alcohol dehydrogenase family protein [Alphaproteobacteria bacterium]|nr:zinc-dependent alcohol dehydrogenase family protein [Alphaproteobacteria bacterium]
MRAMVMTAAGGAEVLQPAEVPEPILRPGHLLIRVAATSVNPADVKIRRSGAAIGPELPGILGMDVAGIVEAVGAGVGGFAPGDRVYGCAGGLRGLPGASAALMLADARLVAPAPPSLSLAEAAALPLVTITAWEGLFDRARLAPGRSVLVQGGTGGVGHVAVQLAKARGARVVAAVSSPEKAAIARRLGADGTIDYRREALAEQVAAHTGGRGFDLVFDATGGDNLAADFAAARVGGQVVTIVTGYTADLAPMHGKGLSLHAVFMLIPMLHDQDRARHGEILREAAALVEAGALRPLLDPRRFRLEELAEAHRHLESGQAVGKVVVEVDPALAAGQGR